VFVSVTLMPTALVISILIVKVVPDTVKSDPSVKYTIWGNPALVTLALCNNPEVADELKLNVLPGEIVTKLKMFVVTQFQ
jgi:competence protein ComGC